MKENKCKIVKISMCSVEWPNGNVDRECTFFESKTNKSMDCTHLSQSGWCTNLEAVSNAMDKS